jgi:uncharacterized protein YeaO (DUF488 family)
MSIRVVRLGTPRQRGEGLRIGTVRRPPRGVPKAEIAKRDFYDVWMPDLAPSAELVALFIESRDEEKLWKACERRYRTEMKAPERARLLDLLVAMSRQTDFAVGCYCEDENRCHRSILRKLLEERGADVR